LLVDGRYLSPVSCFFIDSRRFANGSVLVLDCRAFGGQAGASARIENYLGFPIGISGIALMARPGRPSSRCWPLEAAISLENIRLYDDLKDREAKIRRLVDSNIVGVFTWELEGDSRSQ
jgi:hypothetical protein